MDHMIVLNFDVKRQRIIQKNKEYLVNHTLHFLELSFTFDELWESFYTKYIIFKYNEKNYLSVLSVDETGEYRIVVPSIVLRGNSFRFTIYSLLIVAGVEERITAQEVTVKLHDSGFTDDISRLSDDSNVDIFTTIFDKFGEKYDDIIMEEDKIICKSEGVILKVLPLNVFLHDYYTKSDTDSFLESKADIVHGHQTVDVSDFEENVNVDLEKFIDCLTENIRIL